MRFGEKIKTLREKKGLTQRELASILGTTSKTVSNYEAKDLRPRKMEVYEKMAEIFEVNVNYLLTEEEYFIMNSTEHFGYQGTKDAQSLLKSMTGLFAGGELPEEDKDALFEAIQEAYWQSKLENKKYANRKK
ncbi:helix-turn-helix domain-containing protein [Campylobacter sp. RM16192]|uniref:helix-turn-helix domain-containing protein n=1 Tax=Campylobacter sp. RM16192 TaxID=1660080 RepID=UPI001599A55F|nr:helix-turn-helix transcriptional regulator [Campylobacter sp. RM16192]QKU36237.1 putative transcriptional regulator [Campylobacter sp. RM16192]